MGIAGRQIVLVGLMGSGKSSVGRRLAQITSRKFFDTDRIVEETHGHSVREMFETVGEAEFRRRETEALRQSLETGTPAVIAAAGGVVISESNRELLKEATRRGDAFVVWLDTDTHELAHRVQRGAHRPLLDNDPVGTLETMSVERHSMYAEVATHVVETTGCSLDEVVREVARVLEVDGGESDG